MQPGPREAGEDAGTGEIACRPVETGLEGAVVVPSTNSQLHGCRLCGQPFVCLIFPIPLPLTACSQPICWDLPGVRCKAASAMLACPQALHSLHPRAQGPDPPKHIWLQRDPQAP